MKLFTRTIYKH